MTTKEYRIDGKFQDTTCDWCNTPLYEDELAFTDEENTVVACDPLHVILAIEMG